MEVAEKSPESLRFAQRLYFGVLGVFVAVSVNSPKRPRPSWCTTDCGSHLPTCRSRLDLNLRAPSFPSAAYPILQTMNGLASWSVGAISSYGYAL
jgi:hypothetical protein